MKIESIAATGLKIPGFYHDLAPLTLITGDNGSGKTAITDAIKIALLRRHPVLGSKPGSLMELCCGDLMEIELQLDGTKAPIQMSWKRKGKGTKSDHIDHPEHGELYDLIIPAALDFGTFANAKPTERQRILEGLMGEAEDSSGPIKDHIASMVQKAAELLENVTSSTAAPGWLPTFQCFEQAAREALRACTQDTTRLKGALQQSMVDEATEELARDIHAINPADIRAAEKDANMAAELYGAKKAEVDRIATAQMRAPDQPEASMPTLAELAEARAKEIEAATLEGDRIKAASHNDRIHREIRRIDGLVKDAPDAADKPTDPDVANELITTTAGLHREAEEEGRKAWDQIQRCEQNAKRLKRERNELIKAGECPTCHTAGADLENAVMEVYGAKLIENSESLTAARQQHAHHCDRTKKLNEEHKELVERKKAWDKYNAAKMAATLLDERRELASELEPLPEPANLAQATRANSAMQTLREEWAEWKARTKEVPTKEEATAALEQLEEAKLELEASQARLDELRANADSHDNARQRVRDQQRYTEELEKSKAAEADLKAAAGWAKEKSKEAAAEALRPILTPANAILDKVIEGTLQIHGTDIGICRQVTEAETNFIKLEVLSGAEAATVAAAIQTAMAGKSAVRTVIIDELSRLRPERKQQMILNMDDAITDGMIEQAILLDHDASIFTELATANETAIIECA